MPLRRSKNSHYFTQNERLNGQIQQPKAKACLILWGEKKVT
jgi:hypothetical protein